MLCNNFTVSYSSERWYPDGGARMYKTDINIPTYIRYYVDYHLPTSKPYRQMSINYMNPENLYLLPSIVSEIREKYDSNVKETLVTKNIEEVSQLVEIRKSVNDITCLWE